MRRFNWPYFAVVILVCFQYMNIHRHETKIGSFRTSSLNSFRLTDASQYQPSALEVYLLSHKKKLRYDIISWVCPIYDRKERGILLSEADWDGLQLFIRELDEYKKLVLEFEPISDLRYINDENVCDMVKLHPEDMKGIFKSGQLSFSSKYGYVEPLLPPLRHPKSCTVDREYISNNYTFDLSYLLHDWYTMCKNIKPTSKTILVDMGASLSFHKGDEENPIMQLIDIYNKFGFHFDHIYAFEATPTNSTEHYEMLPSNWLPSYHWINTPVVIQKESNRNPWNFLKVFSPDDLIVVKLDIDTSDVELPLVRQLIDDQKLHNLVDHFYFEHHVKLKEMMHAWARTGHYGSFHESLQLFTTLRERGIAAHSWI